MCTGRQECNAQEPLLQSAATFEPAVRLGCTVEEAFQEQPSYALADHLRLFGQEQYLLVWQQGKGRLVLKQGAQPRDEIRALWQVRWHKVASTKAPSAVFAEGHAPTRLHIPCCFIGRVPLQSCRKLMGAYMHV